MSSTQTKAGKPFLRALKLAYKLHQAGATVASTLRFAAVASLVPPDKLPSAAAPCDVIIAEVYNSVPDVYFTDLDQVTAEQLADQLGYSVKEVS